jgi:uncharacterized protein (TIGR00255 family)
MIRSMTGYGRSSGALGKFNAEVEIKSVNNRYCEVKTHFPRNFVSFEQPCVALVKKVIRRGRLEVFVRLGRNPEITPVVQLDSSLAREITRQANDLKQELDMDSGISLAALLQIPGLLSFEDEAEDKDKLWGEFAVLIEAALERLLSSKCKEGEALAADILKRANLISDNTAIIDTHRHLVVDEYREKLNERIRALTENTEVDETRMATEVAYYADRSDITEELVRLKTHIKRLIEIVEMPVSSKKYKSVGRELDFVIQEMLRETNTTNSKASSMDIIKPALDIKSEIEKIREQVQNVE